MSSEPRLKQKEHDREDLEQVEQFLVKVRRRLRLVEAVRLTSLCIFASSALLIAGRIFTLFVPTVHAMHTWFRVAAAAVILTPVVVAALIASTRKYSLLFLARYSDEKLDLKDQLATAMSVGLSLMHPTFAKMVVGDAAIAASTADAKRVVTVRWGPAQTAAAAAFALACVVTAIPGRPLSMANMKKPELLPFTIGVPTAAPVQKVQPIPASTPKLTNPTAPTSKANSGKSPPSSSAQKGAANADSKANALSAASTLVSRASSQIGAQASTSKNANASSAKSSSAPSGAPSTSSDSSKPGAPASSNDVPSLGDKLREFANRLSIRPLTSGEEEQASGSLEKVNRKLDGLQMPLTQHALSSAEQDLSDSQQQQAISDIRKAAYYADHEGATPPPSQPGGQAAASKDAVSVPEKNSATAGSASQDSSGSTGKQGQSSSGKGENAANSSSGASGTSAGAGGSGKAPHTGPGGPSSKGQSGLGSGGGTQVPGFGKQRHIDPGHVANLPPIALPISQAGGRSSTSYQKAEGPGEAAKSTVPSLNLQPRFVTQTTSPVVGSESRVPPAYADIVRRYFSGGQAPH